MTGVQTCALPIYDYVLVARGTTVARPFPALLSDIVTALKAAHRKLDAKAGEV